MVSVALHELSHLLAHRYYGNKSGIIFLPFLAFTYPINGEKLFKWDRMNKALWVTSAGLIATCTLGFILLGLGNAISSWLEKPTAGYLLIAALLNFNLALLNLAPILGMTDGERIIKTVMYCFSEERKKATVLFLTLAELAAVVGTWVMFVAGKILPSLVLWIFFFFAGEFGSKLGSEIRMRRQPLQPTPEGLTRDEAMRHALIYFGLVVLTLFGLWLLPVSKITSLLWK